MMEFKEALLGATAAVAGNKGAAATVAEQDSTLDVSLDVPRAGYKAAAPTRPVCSRELLPGEVLEQRR